MPSISASSAVLFATAIPLSKSPPAAANSSALKAARPVGDRSGDLQVAMRGAAANLSVSPRHAFEIGRGLSVEGRASPGRCRQGFGSRYTIVPDRVGHIRWHANDVACRHAHLVSSHPHDELAFGDDPRFFY